MRDLFDGNPNLANQRKRVSLSDVVSKLRVERESLILRIKPGVSGVVELRLRLKLITHRILRMEADHG
jgi:hypothetical protein